MSTRLYPSRVITPKGEETAYGYDTVGRRLSISNTYGTVELAYNSRNFVTSRIEAQELWGLCVKVFSKVIVVILNYVFSKRIIFKK